MDEPDFDRSRDRNIVVQGSGELGRLMGDFIWNQTDAGGTDQRGPGQSANRGLL
jgi:hypothetical protein